MCSEDVFARNWCGLNWSEWIPLKDRGSEFKKIPSLPGVYRVRAKGERNLLYIGQTGKNLRQRLAALSTNTYLPEMPFNDPHTAAPNLWVYQRENGFEYECSGASTRNNNRERKGLEDYLLWRHRITTGVSTLCNYGRFHKSYLKSKNASSGVRGQKLPVGEENSASGASTNPLILSGSPAGLDWMGLDWDIVIGEEKSSKKLSTQPCVYKMVDRKMEEVVYIGQTINCSARLQNHSVLKQMKLDLELHEVHVCIQNSNILPHQLHEIESDLLGAFFYLKRTVPNYQY